MTMPLLSVPLGVREAALHDPGEAERIDAFVRERSDGRWSLPGGWADPGDTPARAAAREVREETGYGVEVTKLVGCWDRDAQGMRPRLPTSVYKLHFLCRATGEVGEPDALETLDVGWFPLDALPPLSGMPLPLRSLRLDAEGVAARRFDARPGTTYLLRPDQHVCARWRSFDAARIRAALLTATGVPC